MCSKQARLPMKLALLICKCYHQPGNEHLIFAFISSGFFSLSLLLLLTHLFASAATFNEYDSEEIKVNKERKRRSKRNSTYVKDYIHKSVVVCAKRRNPENCAKHMRMSRFLSFFLLLFFFDKLKKFDPPILKRSRI